MKLKIAFASIIAVTVLAPNVGFAHHVVVNGIPYDFQGPGEFRAVLIPTDDRESRQKCKDAGGQVTNLGDKTVCAIPATK